MLTTTRMTPVEAMTNQYIVLYLAIILKYLKFKWKTMYEFVTKGTFFQKVMQRIGLENFLNYKKLPKRIPLRIVSR